jgi:hypothetical protein
MNGGSLPGDMIGRKRRRVGVMIGGVDGRSVNVPVIDSSFNNTIRSSSPDIWINHIDREERGLGVNKGLIKGIPEAGKIFPGGIVALRPKETVTGGQINSILSERKIPGFDIIAAESINYISGIPGPAFIV